MGFWDRAGIQQQLRALGGRHHGRRRSWCLLRSVFL